MRAWATLDWTSHLFDQIGDPESSIVYLTPDIAGPRISLLRRGQVMAEALRLAEAGAVVVAPTASPDILGDVLPERLIPALRARTQAELDEGIGKLARTDAHCCALWLSPTEALDLSFALAMVQPTYDDPLADALFQSAVNDGLAHGPMVVNWVVVDGGDEPMRPTWVAWIRDQCAAASVPFTFLSWGEFVPVGQRPPGTNSTHIQRFALRGKEQMWMVGRARSGALLDGVAHDARPEVAR